MIIFFAVIAMFGIVFGALAINHVNPLVLAQPSEWFLIIGMSIVTFMLSNPQSTRGYAFRYLAKCLAPPSFSKNDYLNLLSFMLTFLRYCKSTQAQELDSHLENPNNSYLFQNCTILMKYEPFQQFMCDYFRMISMGIDDPKVIEVSMESDIQARYNAGESAYEAFSKLGDALPGLGIVAAVLGVIVAMGAVGNDPAVLAAHIAAALVGTFSGVLLAYAFVYPIASLINKINETEIAVFASLQTCIVGYIRLLPPTIIVETVRSQISICSRPTFNEVEEFNFNAQK